MMLELLEHAGAWLLLLVPLHLLPLLLDSRGWRSLLHRTGSDRLAPWRVLLAIAAVREAINRLLPVANVGGDLIGIRLLTLRGVRGPVAAASVIVEVLLTLISQYAFVALGVFCLLRVTSPFNVSDLLVTLAVALPVIVGIGLLFRYGSLFERGGRLIERLFGQGSQWRALLLQSAEVDAEIARLYRAHAGLLSAAGWQLWACSPVRSRPGSRCAGSATRSGRLRRSRSRASPRRFATSSSWCRRASVCRKQDSWHSVRCSA